jgi:coatomer subunit beta'
LAGSHDGLVYVYNYERKMQKITSFGVHNDFVIGTLNSLAVHPTRPYVLSPCSTQLKLWDWDKGWFSWKCIQTFVGHSENVCDVAFNPQDTNSFVSASHDCTIKVLVSLYSFFARFDVIRLIFCCSLMISSSYDWCSGLES